MTTALQTIETTTTEAQPSSRPSEVRPAHVATVHRVIGQSASIQEVGRLVASLATTRGAALFIGAPGTGKRFFARMMHEMGPKGPFVLLACDGAIGTADLERYVASAKDGTLVIDRFDHLELSLQDKLLALLTPEGAANTTRLVGTLEGSIDDAVGEGRVRPELAAMFEDRKVLLPKLTERAEDMGELVHHFFQQATARARRTDLRGISPEAIGDLEAHVFVENAAGLARAIEQAVAFAEGPYVTTADLPEEIRRPQQNTSPILIGSLPAQGLDLRSSVEEFETRMILQALERTGWNKNRASRLLGLNRTTLVEMIKRKRLVPPLGVRKAGTNVRQVIVVNDNHDETSIAAE